MRLNAALFILPHFVPGQFSTIEKKVAAREMVSQTISPFPEIILSILNTRKNLT